MSIVAHVLDNKVQTLVDPNAVDNSPESVPPRALVGMIEGSPNLVHLSLKYEACEVLWNIKSPLNSLRHLRLERDSTTPEIDCPQLRHFVDFFKLHPSITDLELGYINGIQTIGSSPPIGDLLPSLKRFVGPGALCAEVVTSSIAAQLESLIVQDEHNSFSSYIQSVHELAQVVKSLPKLEELHFFSRGATIWGVLNTGSLNMLLSATPALVSLGISCFSMKLVCH